MADYCWLPTFTIEHHQQLVHGFTLLYNIDFTCLLLGELAMGYRSTPSSDHAHKSTVGVPVHVTRPSRSNTDVSFHGAYVAVNLIAQRKGCDTLIPSETASTDSHRRASSAFS